MSATSPRDQVTKLARSQPQKALEQARKVTDPWYRAQALSWVARFTDGNPLAIALESAKAARECDDGYKQSAVRAWEIAALAERSFTTEARKCLQKVLLQAKDVTPVSSRSEALFLLMQAAFKISSADAAKVYEIMKESCPPEDHWRCKRALREGEKMFAKELEPRPFFW